MGADVAEQVVEHLSQAFRISRHRQVRRRFELDRTARLERARRVDRVARELGQVDRLALERPALVEPREQQQVVDEEPHPPRLALDSRHRPSEIVGPVARAALEQLGVRLHGRERRPQLVRRVAHEAPQTLLGLRPLAERLLDLAEHRVEREPEAPDLGALVRVLDSPAEVARGDRAGGRLDPPQRQQPHADEPEAEPDDRGDDP